MKTLFCLLFLLPLIILAQPTVLYGPEVVGIGHVSASVVVASDDAVSATISYGTSIHYQKLNVAMGSAATSPKTWRFIFHNPGMGLLPITPNTPYHYQITLRDANGALTVLPDQGFRTLADSPIEDAELPSCSNPNDCNPNGPVPADVGNTMPPGPYTDYVLSSCDQLPALLSGTIADLDDAVLGNAKTVRIIIPAGASAACAGQGTALGYYTFPARPKHTGWVILQSNKVGTDEFSPEGVRAGPQWDGKYLKVYNNLVSTYRVSVNSISSLNKCATTDSVPDTLLGLSSLPAVNPPLFPFVYCGVANADPYKATNFPDYTGCTTVTAMTGSLPVTATVDCGGGLPNSMTPGMLVTVPANEYTIGGTYLVQSVSGPSVVLYNLTRKEGYAPLSAPITVSVVSDWRMPIYQPTAFDSSKTPQYRVGSGEPQGRCPENMFYLDSSVTPNQAYWCVDDTGTNEISSIGVWRRIYSDNGSDAVIRFAAGAARYRFVGVEIIVPKVPNPSPAGWFLGKISQNQGKVKNPISISGDRIVLDRVWGPHPENDSAVSIRFGRCLGFGGANGATNSAILNSHIGPCYAWATFPGQVVGSQGVVVEGGSNHLLFENNVFDSQTIGSYIANGARYPSEQHMAWRRNLFTRAIWMRRGSQAYADKFHGSVFNGVQYVTRNAWELKEGHHMLVEGNIFDSMFASITSGSSIALTNLGAGYSASTGVGWYRDSITSVEAGGVIHLAAPSSYYDGEVVMISGMDNPAWNGFHTIVPGGGCGFVKCSQITVTGTSGTSSPLVSGATVTEIMTDRGIFDITIRFNWFRRGADPLNLASIYGAASGGRTLVKYSRRIMLTDNLWQSHYGAYYGDQLRKSLRVPVTGDTGGFYSIDGNKSIAGRYFNPEGHAFEHFQIMRNTVVDQRGTNLQSINKIVDGGNLYGVRWKKDLIHYAPGQTLPATMLMNWTNNYYGSDIGPNVVCCGMSSQAANDPSGTFKWPAAESGIGFSRTPVATPPAYNSQPNNSGWLQRGDFRLKSSSKYISGGSHPGSEGKGFGVDIDQLHSKLGLVANVRARQIQAAQATISYLAPDSDACTVEVSTDAAWGTQTLGGRYVDGGGDRVRNVSATGLSAGTLYRARVLCAVEQPEITFTTLP